MSRIEEIEARKLELRDEVAAAETTEQVDELEKEADALNEEAEQIAEQEKNEEVAEELEEKSYAAKELEKVEVKSMKENMKEFRNSEKYINAFAEYVKGNNEEMRALLTENAPSLEGDTIGTIAVPDMVYEIVKTAWEREDLMAKVRTLSVKGNLKVQFEVSSTDAQVHLEGGDPVSEEQLVLGVVTMIPKSIKKWISISDEAMDLRGEAFLEYIYDELTYRIAKKAADELISYIVSLPQSLTPNDDGIYEDVSANKVSAAPAIGTIAEAIANLSDETRDITIVMNKLTYAAFKQAQYSAQYAADIFEGATVVFNNTLPAYGTATNGAVYAIVGDFNHGALANYPNGEGIELKYDDKTLMTSDLVRILGRRYVAVAPVADKAFALITKPTSV